MNDYRIGFEYLEDLEPICDVCGAKLIKTTENRGYTCCGFSYDEEIWICPKCDLETEVSLD